MDPETNRRRLLWIVAGAAGLVALLFLLAWASKRAKNNSPTSGQVAGDVTLGQPGGEAPYNLQVYLLNPPGSSNNTTSSGPTPPPPPPNPDKCPTGRCANPIRRFPPKPKQPTAGPPRSGLPPTVPGRFQPRVTPPVRKFAPKPVVKQPAIAARTPLRDARVAAIQSGQDPRRVAPRRYTPPPPRPSPVAARRVPALERKIARIQG